MNQGDLEIHHIGLRGTDAHEVPDGIEEVVGIIPVQGGFRGDPPLPSTGGGRPIDECACCIGWAVDPIGSNAENAHVDSVQKFGHGQRKFLIPAASAGAVHDHGRLSPCDETNRAAIRVGSQIHDSVGEGVGGDCGVATQGAIEQAYDSPLSAGCFCHSGNGRLIGRDDPIQGMASNWIISFEGLWLPAVETAPH